MRVEVNKESFYKTVNLTNKTISVKPSTPVLNNLLVKASGGGLGLVGTNLDTTIKSWVAAKVEETGETTVPARFLSEFLATLTEEKLVLMQEKETMSLKTAKVSAKIPTISAKEFPSLPQVLRTKETKVDKKTFIEAIKPVVNSASQDEGRPVLTGVLFKPEGKNTLLVATDGYRLAKKEIASVVSEEAIVPCRDLVELSKILADGESDELTVGISSEENQAAFAADHIEYYSKLIAGEFPDYEQIIPNNFVTSAVLEKEAFLESLRVATTFAKDLGNVVRLSFAEKGACVSASSPQAGEGKVDLDLKIKGQDLEIAFNSRYLVDGVNSIGGEKLEMRFAGPTNPTLIKSEGDDSFIYVVMPVRTQT